MLLEDFKSTKTTKIAILGDLDKSKEVWIVLHGYGQLVQFFIRKFKILKEYNITVIAPEAQSRFYNEGFKGRVGATWMTSEERETDIADYTKYLNSVYKKYGLKTKKVTLLGFSQGGATAGRWYSSNSELFKRLILWSSVFPPDFKLEKFDLSYCDIVMGDNDPFMNKNSFNQLEKLISDNKKIALHTFDGGHDIDSSTLKKLIIL